MERAAAVILPGVGAAGDTIRGLQRHGMTGVVKATIASGKPYFGICMGLQVLLTESEEDGGTPIPWHLRGTAHPQDPEDI